MRDLFTVADHFVRQSARRKTEFIRAMLIFDTLTDYFPFWPQSVGTMVERPMRAMFDGPIARIAAELSCGGQTHSEMPTQYLPIHPRRTTTSVVVTSTDGNG